MNKSIISQVIKKSSLTTFLLLLSTMNIQAAVQYNETTANAWCSSTLHTILNDVDNGYLGLFTEAERNYFLDTECGSGNKITTFSKDEWEDTTLIKGLGGAEKTSKNWYRWGVNGVDSGSYAASGIDAFWTKTPDGASANAFVVNAATGLTTTADVTNDTDYEVLPAAFFDAANVCISDEIGTKDGSVDDPYEVEDGYCAVIVDGENTDDIIVPKNGNLIISGKVYDSHAGKTVTISATIGGVLKTTTVTTPAAGTAWQLTWSWNEMNEVIHPGETIIINFTDGTKTGAISYANTIIVDKTIPVCGTWSPSEIGWKIIPEGTEFTLTGSTDTGGSGLASASASLACTTGLMHNDTCPVMIEDQAGNTTICTSPANKVDIFPPTLTVTSAIQGWQSEQQSIEVTAIDEQTSMARIAYAWSMNNLGSDCTGGTTINSGDDLSSTIIGGENPLYVCARDIAGNVATFSDVYQYNLPIVAEPVLDKNVSAGNMYWNILSVGKNESYLEIKGYFSKTMGLYNYELEYIIPSINKSYTQVLNTSPSQETYFSFLIPVSDFNSSPDNHTFSGPQKLKITDLGNLKTATFDHHLTFFFPIYQVNHHRNLNYFIMSNDSRLNRAQP